MPSYFLNKAEQSITVEPVHTEEIKEYLTLLDLTQSIDVIAMPSGEKMTHTEIAQPGLRYAQAGALIESLLLDPATSTCKIYEIKHSAEVVPEQMRYLLDEDKCKATEHRYGKITGKYVIYRGEDCAVDGVQYLNVEKYLCRLPVR